MLTVAELRKELDKYDGDLPIVVYSYEDGGFAESTHLEVQAPEPTEEEGEADDYDDKLSYFGADHPFSYTPEVTKAVFINGPR